MSLALGVGTAHPGHHWTDVITVRIRSLTWAGAAAALVSASVLGIGIAAAATGKPSGPALTTKAASAAASAAATSAAARSAADSPSVGPVPKGFEPMSFTFVSPHDGWVLGTAPCAHAPCTSVVRTVNGGATWRGIPAPVYKLSRYVGGAGLDRIRFASTANGYAYGSQLWVTHDGGNSWYPVTLPGFVKGDYITDLETSSGVAYATVATHRSRVTVYRSAVGTDSWSQVAGLPGGVTGSLPFGVVTLHGTAAWIILGSRVYSSQNGINWSREHFRCGSFYQITSIAAESNRHVTLLCVGNAGLGSTEKVLYASSNGGSHYVKVGEPPRGGDGGYLAQPTLDHLFIATSSGATWLYASTDGGHRWHDNFTLFDGGKGWSDFGFTTSTQGAAVDGSPSVGSHLYMTWNAGRVWHKIAF
jgi:hypothetical protein